MKGVHPDFIQFPRRKNIAIGKEKDPEDFTIRWLLSSRIPYKPHTSDYRVVLFPEANRINNEAETTLLKTLEEPPAHVVFILATTETHKIPETVLSRCEVYTFKKPSQETLKKLTISIAKKEGSIIDDASAELVAILGDGSYRDALSVLQKVFAAASGTSTSLGAGKKLTREEVEQATGAPKREQVHALINALAAGERGKALEAIERAGKADVDMKLFLELVLETLRATLLIRYAPELRASLADEFGADEFAALEKFAHENPSTKLGAGGITHATMLAFLTAAERIRYAPIPALPLELAVLELFPE